MNRQPHFGRVKAIFGGNSKKARLWFRTPNPLLGDISPDQMLENGRHRRLKKFIDEAE